MPIVEEYMDVGSWSVDLDPNTPTNVLDSIDVRTYLWASIVITPQWFRVGDLSAANLLAQSRYTGVYMEQAQDRLTLAGPGLAWWMDGIKFTGPDRQTATATFSSHISTWFGTLNGLTTGTIDNDASTFHVKLENGDTRLELLDALCDASDPQNVWQVTAAGVLNADARATLWPTATTPTVILTEEGGRDGAIDGLRAELALGNIDGSQMRSKVWVDWSDGNLLGSSTITLPSTYVGFGGSAPTVVEILDSQPRVQPESNVKQWRRVSARQIRNQTAANQVAAAEAAERDDLNIEISAELPDVYDPWRFDITPGNSVYVYDLDRKLYNTAAEVYYRGAAVHPTTGRVDRMDSPILDGYGVYLRKWTGAAFEFTDLTPYVEFEEGPVSLSLNHRGRFPTRRGRKGRVNRRAIRRQALKAAKRQRYADRLQALARARNARLQAYIQARD